MTDAIRSNDGTIPAGCLPAFHWWGPMLDTLRIVGDELVWFGHERDRVVLWRLPTSEAGRERPRPLATFPTSIEEYVGSDGVVDRIEHRHSCLSLVADDRWFYFEHRFGVGRVAREGGEPEVVARIEPRPCEESRTVLDVALVAGELWVAGRIWFETDDDGGDGAFVVRVVNGQAVPVWADRRPAWNWPQIRLHALPCCTCVQVGDDLFRIDRDGAVELCGAGGPSATAALPSGLYGISRSDALVRLDPETGAVAEPLIGKLSGEPTAMAEVGDWLWIAAHEGADTRLIAVRRDGHDARSVLRVSGDIADLCSDGRFLYWLDRSNRCLCRIPVIGEGHPVDLAFDVPAPVRPRREPTPAQRRKPPGLPPPDRVTDEVKREITAAVAAAFLRAPPPEQTRVLPLPWLGWMWFALVRYRAQMHAVIRAADRVPFKRGEGTVPGTDWTYSISTYCDDLVTVVKPDGTRIDLRARGAGDGVHLLIDPDWISEYAFSRHIEERRDRCPAAARLWRWLPARGLIERLAGWYGERFGATRDTARWPHWQRLPSLPT